MNEYETNASTMNGDETIPLGVRQLRLASEYRYCERTMKDKKQDRWKRKVAEAMKGEIEAAGVRKELKKKRVDVVSDIPEEKRVSIHVDPVKAWLEDVCKAVIWKTPLSKGRKLL